METVGEFIDGFCRLALMVCELKARQQSNAYAIRNGGKVECGSPKIMIGELYRLRFKEIFNLPPPDDVWVFSNEQR